MLKSSININFIISIFIFKLILALYFPLINDEAYTIAVSKSMSLSFYDHPPITFWLPVLINEVFGTNSIFIYRLPFLLIGLTTTLMIYLLGKEFGGTEIGIGSALLYNIVPFFFLSGGIFIVPDGPLNLGIATTTYCILKLHKSTPRQTRFFFLLLGLGLCLCFASKYQGYLIGLGCLIVLWFSRKRNYFIKNPFFYISIAIALIGMIPTIMWNIQHNWVSFNFHSSRQGFSIQVENLFIIYFGLMIYLLPQLVIIPGLVFIKFLKSITKQKYITREFINSSTFQLGIISLPNFIIFNFVFLTSKGSLPHWIIPSWLVFLPIIVKYIYQNSNKINSLLFNCSFIIIWSFLGLLIIHSQLGIITNHKKVIPNWDNTLELINWQKIHKKLEQEITKFSVDNNVKLAAFTWTEAGQLSTVMDNKYEMVVIDGDPHHFQFMKKTNQQKPTILVKLVLGTKPDTVSILNRLKVFDNNAQHINNIIIKRGNRDYATASLFLFKQ